METANVVCVLSHVVSLVAAIHLFSALCGPTIPARSFELPSKKQQNENTQRKLYR